MDIQDNWVLQVAKMQMRIDDLEACFENLFLNIRETKTYTMSLRDDVDDFKTAWDFVYFVKRRYPHVLDDFNGRAQEERQEQTQQPQERKTTPPDTFWTRLSGAFRRPQ